MTAPPKAFWLNFAWSCPNSTVVHAREIDAQPCAQPDGPARGSNLAGGVTVPLRTRQRIIERIEKYAAKDYSGKYMRLDSRFRGPLCYIDAYVEPEPPSKSLLKNTGETHANSFSSGCAPCRCICVGCAILQRTAGAWHSSHVAMSATNPVFFPTALS